MYVTGDPKLFNYYSKIIQQGLFFKYKLSPNIIAKNVIKYKN